MRKQRSVSTPPHDKSTDKAFVIAVLRAVSRNLKSIDGIVEAAGVGLSQDLLSPEAAIVMTNQVAPGCVEAVMRDFEIAEVGTGYTQEGVE